MSLIPMVMCTVAAAMLVWFFGYLYGRTLEANVWADAADRLDMPVMCDDDVYYVITYARREILENTKLPEPTIEYVVADLRLTTPYPTTLEAPPRV